MSKVKRHEVLRALDAQVSLIKEYKSPRGIQYLQSFVEDMFIRRGSAQTPPPGYTSLEDWCERTGENYANDTSRILDGANTFYVAEDMMALAQQAATNLPATTFTADDLPCPAGYVELSRPLVINDANGEPLSMRAFSFWMIDVSFYDGDGNVDPNIKESLFMSFYSCTDDADVDTGLAKMKNDPELWPRVNWYHVAHWALIAPGEDWWEKENANVDGNILSWLAFVKTFFLLVNQEIATVSRQRPDRATSRRLAREGHPPDYGDVDVVTLRHTRPVNENTGLPEEGGPGWTHRWLVTGHWRNQYFPKSGTHKPIWIQAFVKGPDDKPFIAKDRVFVWKR